MRYAEALEKANESGGIVIKINKYDYQVARSMWSFAVSVAQQPSHLCYYEVVSNHQCTYLDLDLKFEDCCLIPKKLQLDIWQMPRQCMDLLD